MSDDWIERDGELIRLAGRAVQFMSRSEPGTIRTVSGGICDCPGWAKRHRCRHTDFVVRLDGGTPTPWGSSPAATPSTTSDYPQPVVATGWPTRPNAGRVWTGRYGNRAIPASGLVPVGITLGHPRWKLSYSVAAKLPTLTPTKAALAIPSDAAFVQWFRARLDAVGADYLSGEFQGLREYHGADPVLLCFEKIGGELCHRFVFAQWWQERTGEPVLELADEPAADPGLWG